MNREDGSVQTYTTPNEWQIRVISINDRPWVVVSDVLKALNLSDCRKGTWPFSRHIDKDDKKKIRIHAKRRGMPYFLTTNLMGLRKMMGLLSWRSDQVVPLLDWLEEEVMCQYKPHRKTEDQGPKMNRKNTELIRAGVDREIRTVMYKGNPWFLGVDVINALGLDPANTGLYYRKLSVEDKTQAPRPVFGMNPGKPLMAVSKEGLEELILRYSDGRPILAA